MQPLLRLFSRVAQPILTVMTNTTGNAWLYDGAPENVGLLIPDAAPGDGGYLLLAEMHNGDVRMFATRFPARCVAGWKSTINKFGAGKLNRVLVSSPHIRYEHIKRLVIESAQEEGTSALDFYKAKTAQLLQLRIVGRVGHADIKEMFGAETSS